MLNTVFINKDRIFTFSIFRVILLVFLHPVTQVYPETHENHPELGSDNSWGYGVCFLLEITIGVAFILLLFSSFMFWNKHKQGLPLSRLEKILMVLDIVVTVIYIALLVAERLPPSTGFQITISPELSWGFLIILVAIVTITIIVRFKQRRSIERIDGVEAFLFFPRGTLEENKTLDHHEKHFHKKLMVNFKQKPPQAYYLHAANTSYSWKLIQKYPDLWTSVEDSAYPDPDTQKWCEEKGYKLNSWSASKKELLKADTLIVGRESIEKVEEKPDLRQTEKELLQSLYFFLEHWGTYKKFIENKQLIHPQTGEIKWCSDQIKSTIVKVRTLRIAKINVIIPEVEILSNDMATLGVDVSDFPRDLNALFGDGRVEQGFISRGDAIYERLKRLIPEVEQAFR